jgi:hypothetical protein
MKVSELSLDAISIYPNPTRGLINIAIDQTVANYDVSVSESTKTLLK